MVQNQFSFPNNAFVLANIIVELYRKYNIKKHREEWEYYLTIFIFYVVGIPQKCFFVVDI
jgi:hypothetical protein